VADARVIRLADGAASPGTARRSRHVTGDQPAVADRPAARPRTRCVAVGPDGRRCRAVAVEDGRCRAHLADTGSVLAAAPTWEQRAAGALAFLRRRLTGDYPIDDFGFDPDLTDHVLFAGLRPIYRRYFRVETRGLDNVPDTGGALVVANHSGTLPLDALMTQLALLDHHPARRHLRMLGADLVFRSPLIAPMARKGGSTLACNEDAERLLCSGELVGVWPEGFKGVGKPFSERYKLQRFGRGGFVSAALRTQVPIVPCAIVGAEEIYPMIGNMRTVARLFGLPYVPVTPFFPWLGPVGMLPLPSKWIIEFGEPIPTNEYGSAAADDPMLVFNLTDQVRETIQQSLYKLLMQRRSVFF
jgi:1-acyl-sn-glycerol-3-phosphate acyltransferase